MSPALEAHERPRVVLHAGMGKTGTTTIQGWLHQHRDRLAERGVLYPTSPGRLRHARVGLAVQDDDKPRSVDWRFEEETSPSRLRPVLERELAEEVRRARPRTLVLSDEALAGASAPAMGRLRDLLGGLASSVRLVIYVRRQDDHLCSRYQQVVKRNGAVQTLAERADGMSTASLYDYAGRLADWQAQLRPDELVVRPFERSAFRDGALHLDFADAAGLDVETGDLEVPPTRNESLDAESVELLRLLNVLRRDQGGGELPGMPRHRRVIRRLTEASAGPTLTLPEARLDAFMAGFAESNRAVAREHLPGGPPDLFAEPRRTHRTTTDQRLDPGRVDHFADLLGLPAGVREGLREVATRAAAGEPGGA